MTLRDPHDTVMPRSAPTQAIQRRRRGIPLTLVVAAALGATATAFAQTASSNIVGTWQLSCTTKKGATRQAAMHIQQDGSKLSGTLSEGDSQSETISGSIQGTHVSLGAAGGKKSFAFAGTLNGNTISGKTQKGLACSATRQ